MTCNKDHSGRLGEAASWYSDLQDPDVTLETWEAFLEWECEPQNAAAFQEIEKGLVGAGDGVGHCGNAHPASRAHPIRNISWRTAQLRPR